VSEQTAGGPLPTIRRRPGQAPSDHSQPVLTDSESRVSGVEIPNTVFAAIDCGGSALSEEITDEGRWAVKDSNLQP
jgi:hypothetical protein